MCIVAAFNVHIHQWLFFHESFHSDHHVFAQTRYLNPFLTRIVICTIHHTTACPFLSSRYSLAALSRVLSLRMSNNLLYKLLHVQYVIPLDIFFYPLVVLSYKYSFFFLAIIPLHYLAKTANQNRKTCLYHLKRTTTMNTRQLSIWQKPKSIT
jgi:hypothetical protein